MRCATGSTRRGQAGGWLLAAAALLSFGLFSQARADEPERRRFEFTYGCRVTDVPADARQVDVWLPAPIDFPGQRVHAVDVLHPAGATLATEPEYGNRMLHARFTAPLPEPDELGATLRFDVERTEIVVPEAKRIAANGSGEPVASVDERATHEKTPDELAVYLEPDALIPLDGPVAELAADARLGGDRPLVTGRKAYDYLLETMQYNWLAKGAGRGDVRWACDSKTGDCTDYHSTFLALCRSQGVPADHQFGFPLPRDKREGAVSHYHCWARFWAPGPGWVPVDISEADKHPELTEYNFGSLTAHQLQLTHGRDLLLAPPQQGERLNIFVYPYVEVDGRPHDGVKWTAAFRDVE